MIEVKYADLKMNELSDKELSDLIKMAMTEFQNRLDLPTVSRNPQQIPERKVIFSPPDNHIVFINKKKKKEYVHADEKDRYKELASKYIEWFKLNAYPMDLRGSEFRKWKEYRR